MQYFDDPRSRDSERFAFDAEHALKLGDEPRALALFAEAARLEDEVATQVSTSPRVRSLLAVSATALWHRAAKYKEAQACAIRFLHAAGLNTQAESELKRLLQRSWQEEDFRKGLSEGQDWMPLEINLDGGLVREGLAPSSLVRDRQQGVTSMLLRVTEWRLGQPFRMRGEATQRVLSRAQVLEAPALSGSYGLQLYVTSALEPSSLLPPPPSVGAREIVDQFLGLATLAQEAPARVREVVSDPSYADSFLVSLRDLAADGQKVGSVSLASARSQRGGSVRLDPGHREAITKVIALTAKERTGPDVGVLKVVNLPQGFIAVQDENGMSRKFRIAKGQFDDTIGPMLNHLVRVVLAQFPSAGDPFAEDVLLAADSGAS